MKKHILVWERKSGTNSFDDVLFLSKIANYNLISSILPSNAKQCKAIGLKEGDFFHTAHAHINTKKEEQITAAVVVYTARDSKYKSNYGVLGAL